MKVALVFLTWNRLDFVKRAVQHNYETAGYEINEIFWVDNGSTDGTVDWMLDFLKDKKATKVLYKENTGCGIGYNTAYKLIQMGDFDLVARPSSDMCMPKNWLKDMVLWHERIPTTGITAMISKSYEHVQLKRFLGQEVEVNGYKIQIANALGSIVFRKKILDDNIFLPILKNKYGYEDTLWTQAVKDAGYLNYYIPGLVDDFPQEEVQKYGDYVKWKGAEAEKFEENNKNIVDSLKKFING